ncbi:MAG: hypothetical protein K2X48_09335 [Chitinophagaceae bacterium]|nr:hypothetical protein [Chitinophagaceae bacterium]
MTTTLKVNSETNGSLKRTKKNILRSLFAGFVLASVAMVGMSFTTNDTNRISDTAAKTTLTSNGNNRNAIAPVSEVSIHNADLKMDANFRTAEKRNTALAVAFGKTVACQASEADEQLTDLFLRNVVNVAFFNSLQSEMAGADASIDVMANDEMERNAKAVAFRNTLSTQANDADASMDVMFTVNNMKTIRPADANEADRLMDELMDKTTKNVVSTVSVQEADSRIDELFNKQ